MLDYNRLSVRRRLICLFISLAGALFLTAGLPATAQKPGYIYQECTITPGINNWLFLHTSISARLTHDEPDGSAGTYYSPLTDVGPGTLTVHNGGKYSCYVYGIYEVPPGQTRRIDLGLYASRNNPIRSVMADFDIKPEDVYGVGTPARSDAQQRAEFAAYYQNLLDQLTAMQTTLDKTKAAASHDDERLAAAVQKLQSVLLDYAKLLSAGADMTGPADLAKFGSQLDALDAGLKEAASILKGQARPRPAPLKDDAPAKGAVTTEANPAEMVTFLFHSQGTTSPNKESLSATAEHYRVYLGDATGMNGGFFKPDGKADDGSVDGIANRDAIETAVTPAQAAFIAEYLRNYIKVYHLSPDDQNNQSRLQYTWNQEGIRRMSAKSGNAAAPASPAPAAPSPPAQPSSEGMELNALVAQLARMASSLPHSGNYLGGLSQAPAAVQAQYQKLADGLESGNMEQAESALAPDYFFKGEDGKVLTLKDWKRTRAEERKQAAEAHLLVKVDAAVPQGNDLLVTATYITRASAAGPEAPADHAKVKLVVHTSVVHQTGLKVKDLWTQAGGKWALQSSEVIGAVQTGGGRLLVAQDGSAPFRTLAEAIKAAGPGSEIVLKPGLYREAVVIDRDMVITGEGNREGVILQTDMDPAITVTSGMVELHGLTLQRTGGSKGGADYSALQIMGGDVTVENCLVTSAKVDGIMVRNPQAKVFVTGCKLTACGQSGIDVSSGTVTMEKTEASDDKTGVSNWGGDLTVSECRLHDNHRHGLETLGGNTTVNRTDSNSNMSSGFSLVSTSKSAAIVHLTNCNGNDNGAMGVDVFGTGTTNIDSCGFSGNGNSGLNIAAFTGNDERFQLMVRKSAMKGNKAFGLSIGGGLEGHVVAEDCEVTGNMKTGVCAFQGHVILRRVKIHDNEGHGILTVGGKYTLEDSQVSNNKAD